MANGDEHMMEGGVYCCGDRVDIHLQENVGVLEPDLAIPPSFNLIIVTGASSMEVLEILPKDLIRIGEFLQQVGQELLDRSK